VLELAGYRDVLTKSIGTNNPINQVKATMAGLKALRKPEDVAELRGISIGKVLGLSKKPKEESAEDAEGAVDPVAVATEEAPPEPAAEETVSEPTVEALESADAEAAEAPADAPEEKTSDG